VEGVLTGYQCSVATLAPGAQVTTPVSLGARTTAGTLTISVTATSTTWSPDLTPLFARTALRVL
jgi:hypothetical protein